MVQFLLHDKINSGHYSYKEIVVGENQAVLLRSRQNYYKLGQVYETNQAADFYAIISV